MPIRTGADEAPVTPLPVRAGAGADLTVGADRRAPVGRHVDVPDRGRMYVREALGPRKAPTLLLLHGLGATAALNWDPVIPRLAERFHVVAPDHRGHGRGLRCGARFCLEDCADDVAALIGQLGGGPVLVAGYSMGGPIAMLLARQHPHLVSGLVLCATSRDFSGHPGERLRFAALAPVALASRLTPRLPAFVPDGLRHHHLLGTLVGELAGHESRAVVAAAASLGRFTSRDWAGELTAPAVVVATEGDGLVPLRRQLKLAEALDAPVVRVDGHHLVAHSAPHVFAAAVLEAIDRLPRRLRGPRKRRRLAA